MKGMIFDIKRYALHDGPGIRQTVFFKGCSLRCWWCHNPEGQSSEAETVTRDCTLDGHSFQEEVRVGREMSAEEVVRELKRETVFFDESGGGVTFSGGEPLLQAHFVRELASLCRQNGIGTVLDTCGYASRESFDSILNLVDLFLFDIKLVDDKLHREYTGVSNRAILRNLRHLVSQRRNVIVRFPVIPGITDTPENVDGVLSLLESLGGISEVDLLPYHAIANHKYRQFRIENKMADTLPPETAKVEMIREKFERAGFTVKIGG